METALTKLKTASFFGAFTTPPKIAVIKSLLPGPLHVIGIQAHTGLKQAIVSQMLMQLRRLGMVSFESKGRCKYYQLRNPGGIRQLLAIAEQLAA